MPFRAYQYITSHMSLPSFKHIADAGRKEYFNLDLVYDVSTISALITYAMHQVIMISPLTV